MLIFSGATAGSMTDRDYSRSNDTSDTLVARVLMFLEWDPLTNPAVEVAVFRRTGYLPSSPRRLAAVLERVLFCAIQNGRRLNTAWPDFEGDLAGWSVMPEERGIFKI